MRIGIVAPIDRRSAIARAAVGVALELSREHDVIVFAEPTTSPMRVDLPVRTVSEAAEMRLDQLIVHIGDSPFHREAFHVAQSGRAIVVCHDVVLAHVVVQVLTAPQLKKAVQRWYSEELVEEVMATAYTASPVWDGPQAASVPLFEPVLQHARGIVVHSTFAASMISSSVLAPVGVIPLSYPRATAPNDAGAPPGGPLLATVGHVNPNKRHELVIEALAEMNNRDVTYVIAGAISASRRSHLHALAAGLGVGDRVEIRGGQTDAEIAQLLAQATICVNLRMPAMEGGSASLIEQMAAGRPVVVFDHGCYSDMPDDAVVKLSPACNSSELAYALGRLLDDTAAIHAIGARAAHHAATTHVPSAYARSLLAFCDEVGAAEPLLRVAREIKSAVEGWALPADSPLPDRWASVLTSMLGSFPPAPQTWPDEGASIPAR